MGVQNQAEAKHSLGRHEGQEPEADGITVHALHSER